MFDFTRANFSATPLSTAINNLIEAAEPPEESVRQYLGASTIGGECLRKIQFDWVCDPAHPTRTRAIFARGHFFEEVSRQHLIRAGFTFAPVDRLGFAAANGLFRGHADGILMVGPKLPGMGFPCVWEHKALAAKGWHAIERDGLLAYPQYAAQIWLYQVYLAVTEHAALFTATSADTCERLHLLLPFDAARAQEASDRAVAVIEATCVGELLPRVTDDAADWRCKICGHRKRCWT